MEPSGSAAAKCKTVEPSLAGSDNVRAIFYQEFNNLRWTSNTVKIASSATNCMLQRSNAASTVLVDVAAR